MAKSNVGYKHPPVAHQFKPGQSGNPAGRPKGSKTKRERESYEFLSAEFLEAMNDIGRYGHQKHGKNSFQHRRLHGDRSRGEMKRTTPVEIAKHARVHFRQYLDGIPHDHFKTRKHQLAAAAFNAMMECIFAGLEEE